MRKLAVSSLVVVLVALLGGGTARAHDPIILTADQSTPADGPLLPDGTISFALYGTLEAPGDTRGFRVTFAADDPLYLSVLIPDLAPENSLADELLPYLVVEDPAGAVTELRVDEPVAFAEPFTGTNYVTLAVLTGPAMAGTYSVTIAGDAPSRFTVAVGTKELFGTEVENVPNRNEGVPGVMEWYSSAPPTIAVTTTAVETTVPDTVPVSSTETPTARDANSPAVTVVVPADSTTTDARNDDSGSSWLVFVVLGVIVVVLGGAVSVGRRRSSAK